MSKHPEPRTSGEKRCPAHGSLPVIMFGASKHSADGLQAECRECVAIKQRGRDQAKKFRGPRGAWRPWA